MQKRSHMDLAAWRAAADRGELWMFVDQHWAENAPQGLTEQEWGQHIAARVYVKTGKYPTTLFREISTPELVGSR